MKVQESAYLRQHKPLFAELLEKLEEEFEFASILAVDSKARSYSVSRRNVSVNEEGMYTSRGFVVRVAKGGKYAEASFNELERENIESVLGKVRSVADESGLKLPDGLSENTYKIEPGEKTVFSGSTDFEVDPEEIGDQAILNRLTEIMENGLKVSDKLLDFTARASWRKYSKLFLSKEKDLEENVMWTTGGITAVASKGMSIKSHGHGYSKLGGAELLDEMGHDLEHHVGVALELLDAEPITPGEYECVCDPSTTGMIVHEAFGHGVEMDMFVKKRAKAQEYIGEYVASPLVTMHDSACAVDQAATYFFDDEGTMAHDTVIIDKGVLKTGISDYQSAKILGTVPTGNGRRESYKRKAYTRMTNTWFEGGTDSVEDMISSIKYGFLLEDPSSGMEDPKNWGIQCMVSIAREIKDGKLTGKIFSPIVLTGYVPDLLKSVSAMSPDPVLSGTGFCGKGSKEWVKVSDGGAFMKARVRLG